MKIFAKIDMILLAAIIGFSVNAATSKKRTSNVNKKPIVNIQAIKDSIIILADNYSQAMDRNPEMANIRLNALKNYYAQIPVPEARDSVRNELYDFYTDYIGSENDIRAHDFKNCYMAIAKDDDVHLGPMYAMELAVAQEKFDTISVKETLPVLEAYAQRLDVDYDTDIQTAKDFLDFMRSKKPIQQELRGVWVGESLCTDRIFNPNIIQVFDDNLSKSNELGRNFNIILISDSKIVPCFTGVAIHTGEFPYVGYEIPFDEAENKGKKSYYFETLTPDSWLWKDTYYEHHPRTMQYDDNLRSVYAIWSNYDVSSFDPDYYATLRQCMQSSLAYTRGNLARKSVSGSKKLWGNVGATALYTLGNSLLDRCAVSSATSWISEVTLIEESPKELTGMVYTQYYVSKSNSSYVRELNTDIPQTKYYKWEPEDDVFFIYQNLDIISLGDLSKKKKNEYKSILKQEKELYQQTYGKLGMSTEKWNEFYNWFNSGMLNKLKEKAKNYKYR